MIYLDTSVALAHILAEDRSPPESLWDESLISSRLLEYEVWTRIHTRKLAKTHGEEARAVLSRVAMIELCPQVLVRVLQPFPKPIRTLDAIHLASIDFLRRQGQAVSVASYDDRLIDAARALRFTVYKL